MEDEHEKTFAALRADIAEEDKVTTAFDPRKRDGFVSSCISRYQNIF